jgi:4-amino-4-deoxy-L-arabinose transferase-like glycosyltransferase
MADTKSTATARPFPLGATRRGLTIGGVALVAVNLVLLVTGAAAASGPMLSALLWGGAAVCFLGAFVAYMMEPVAKREDASPLAGAASKAGDSPASPAEPADAKATAAGNPTDNPEGGPADAPAGSTVQDKPVDGAAGGIGLNVAMMTPEERARLLPRGNPLRWTRGGITALLGSLFALLLMAKQGQWRWGVPLGALFVAIGTWGVMDLLGTFDDPDDRLERSTTLADLAGPLGSFIAALLIFCFALGGAQAGLVLPQVAWGLVVALSFVGCVVSFFVVGRKLGPLAVDENGEDRPLWKHHGFWVVTLSAALLFPAMGIYALWDPWETHYGEVAREMLARDDWISLWWVQEGWFWSKPVADMWMQAVAMATLGVHYMPDKMLIGDGTRPTMHPEWAVRAPVVLLTIVAAYLLYKGASKTFGRRAALLGSVVLATMPDWFFIAHQTMTDMPFVGAMTAAMGLVLIGLRTPEGAEARAYEVKVGAARFRLTLWHAVFGAVLVCALPQILYLLSRNFEFLWRPGGHGFRPHWDEFHSGSGGGNCGLPGNEECKATWPASVPHSTGATPEGFGQGLWRTVAAFEPALQGLLWAGALGFLLYMSWGERRTRRLLYLAAWFFAAISTLAKGPAGFGLPMLVTFTYLCASRPGEELFARLQRIVRELTQFEIIAGLLMIAVVALPWYVAMYVRHGSPFTDRLIFHDMFNRAFHHVHDTNEGDDTSFRFYVWQLGYALFPWTGLAPLGLLWWLRRGASKEQDERADASVLLCMWFVFGFALFSFMGTKFHHYIFPAVPPVAMLIGVVLDDMMGPAAPATGRSLIGYLAGMTGGIALMVLGVARMLPGSILGFKPDGKLADPSVVMGAVLAVAGAAVVVIFARMFRSRPPADTATAEQQSATSNMSLMLGAGSIAGALLLMAVARDLIIKPENADQPGAIHLLQLFTYNYRRAWPESLDFSAALAAFAAVAVVVSIGLTVKSVRRHAVMAMCVAGFVWGVWGLDVYMEQTAQHWGQHEVIAAYYADRDNADETLVAYQMNWKGENFYTGNHAPVFVSTGSTFTTWLKKKKDDGAKVMYFVTEHGRVGGLKSEVGGKAYREVTDKVLCNKFVLVRAEL